MATAVPQSAPSPSSSFDTFAELLESIGDVPLSRIRANPPPGTATEDDVVAIHGQEGRLYELLDGVLVEKTVGLYESVLALQIGYLIRVFLSQNDLGVVSGPDGMMRFRPNLVRIPDVAFVSWSRFPAELVRRVAIPDLVPDLAIEVLSVSNTASEMARKLGEYFDAGVRLVWFLDPEQRTMEVFTGVDQSRIVDESGVVDGGDVLPGFTMRVSDIFAAAEERLKP